VYLVAVFAHGKGGQIHRVSSAQGDALCLIIQPGMLEGSREARTERHGFSLGKTWQIKLYSEAFQCAIMRNVNLAKCALFPLKCSFTTVILQT
jgi:hypothetical protein